MDTQQPESRDWPSIYEVKLTSVDGHKSSYRVITWRDEIKAATIVTSAKQLLLDALYDVRVTLVGRAPTSSNGAPDMSGCLLDRNEW